MSANAERIDVWLKLVCLFKHRADATEAVKGGLVKLNGTRVKPATSVKAGDVVEISEPRYRKVVVLDLPSGNVSKAQARETMYRDETPEQPKEQGITGIGERDRGTGRPTKRERREIEKWRY
jgi:ribosome-associated heat shock protein Hsp15